MNGTGSDSGSCSRNTCFAPETACVLGLEPCPHLTVSPGSEETDDAEGNPLPWGGLALGSSDLGSISALGRIKVLALVGAAGAGKTTALAAFWVAARRGGGRYGRAFAGSFTMLGWQQIARHLQWVPHGRGFPPHTSAANNRTPALLHTAMGVGDRHPIHVVYTDVPGEWYRNWAYEANSVPGAVWIAEHADAFVLLSDTEALAGPERGKARGDYEALAERLATESAGRPVIPIISKADVAIRESIRDQVERVNQRLFGADTLSVSVQETVAQPLTDVVDSGVTAVLSRRPVPPVDVRPVDDPFLAYRSVALRTRESD